MSRMIQPIHYTPPRPEVVTGNPIEQIKAQARSMSYQYLLAYAHDGVIWGVVDEAGNLILSSDENAFPEVSPKLCQPTLWEARLFGENAEWYLWKTNTGWRARRIVDSGETQVEIFDESYILWGTNLESSKPPFALVREADTGIRHAPPLTWTGRHKLKITVRHYLDYDDAGAVYVKYSRLAGLSNGGSK